VSAELSDREVDAIFEDWAGTYGPHKGARETVIRLVQTINRVRDERDAAIRRAEELEAVVAAARDVDNLAPVDDVMDRGNWMPDAVTAMAELRAAFRSRESQKPPETEN